MPLSLLETTQHQAIGRYAKEQLIRYEDKFFEVDIDEFWGLNPDLNFHTSIADLPLGIEEIQYYGKEYYGSAAIYDGAATDIPVVDVSLSRDRESYRSAIFINGAKWTRFELEKQREADRSKIGIPSLSLIAEFQRAMAMYLNNREHYTVLYGIPDRGLYGLYNQPGVTTLDVPINLYDEGIGGQAIYNQLISWIDQFVREAKLTSRNQVEIKIPDKLMKRLSILIPVVDTAGLPANTIYTGAYTTIYEMLTSSVRGQPIKRITSALENEGDNLEYWQVFPAGRQRDRIIFKATTEVLERHFYPREQLPIWQIDSLRYEQISFSGTTGLFARRKNRMMYVDFKNV